MSARTLRAVGSCIFVVAFFLPAVREGGGGTTVYKGWYCAGVTIAGTPEVVMHIGRALQGGAEAGVIMTLSGWVNPLVIVYLALCFLRRSVRVRQTVAIAVVACIAFSWITIALCQLVPLIGHFLWVGGIALMLAPEFGKHAQDLESEAPLPLKL